MKLPLLAVPKIHFAPLQGYTDFAYRKAYQITMGNVDVFYSPYLSVCNDGSIDSLADIVIHQPNLIPQILPGSFAEFKILTETIKNLRYQNVNINLGCPYAMVTKRGRGAALIRNVGLVKDFVDYNCDVHHLKLSLKVRSGLENSNEIFKLLNTMPLEKIDYLIIHPRTATQLYKGKPDIEIAKQIIKLYPQISIIYNGDIWLYDDFVLKKEQLQSQNQWMLGRGLLQNPFLAWQIKNNQPMLPENYGEQLFSFTNELIQRIVMDSKNEGHALNRSKNQLTFLLAGFTHYQKVRKKIEKSRSMMELKEYLSAIETGAD